MRQELRCVAPGGSPAASTEPQAVAKALTSATTEAAQRCIGYCIIAVSACPSEQNTNCRAGNLPDDVQQVVPTGNRHINALTMNREQRFRSRPAQRLRHSHRDIPSNVNEGLGHDLFDPDVPHLLQRDKVIDLDGVAATPDGYTHQLSPGLADELSRARVEPFEQIGRA